LHEEEEIKRRVPREMSEREPRIDRKRELRLDKESKVGACLQHGCYVECLARVILFRGF
jgi:hypothetical protein